MKIEDMYVLLDGTQADPADVAKGNDGILRHKNGVGVAMREDGLPQTIGHRSEMNAAAAQAGKLMPSPKPSEERNVDRPNDEEVRLPGEGGDAPSAS